MCHASTARLWDAADALRGAVDPADVKTHVFSDAVLDVDLRPWAYEHDQALDEYGDDLDDEIEADFHRFEMPAGTLWPEVTTKVKNLGAEIARTFRQVEKANPRSLAGVFGDASWGNQKRIPASALIGLSSSHRARLEAMHEPVLCREWGRCEGRQELRVPPPAESRRFFGNQTQTPSAAFNESHHARGPKHRRSTESALHRSAQRVLR